MSKFKIVADSCCDKNEQVEKNLKITRVPLTMKLGDKEFVDDEKLDLLGYLKAMKAYPGAPKTACPSPSQYMDSFEGSEEDVYVITLSDRLSGSYNSAELAKSIYDDEKPKKKIHVFNSKSAAACQSLIALKVQEFASQFSFEDVIKKVENYIQETKTFFVLDDLDHLAKSGRMSKVAANLLNVLNIKLILEGNAEGEISLVDKARGQKRAFKKFLDIIGREGKNLESKVLGISHCNCIEKAMAFKEAVKEKYNFKDIIIYEMTGLTSTYADEGGIVIAF